MPNANNMRTNRTTHRKLDEIKTILKRIVELLELLSKEHE